MNRNEMGHTAFRWMRRISMKGKNQDMTEEEDQGQQEKMENEKKGGLID